MSHTPTQLKISGNNSAGLYWQAVFSLESYLNSPITAESLDWPVSATPPLTHANIRTLADDFQVDEEPPCLPSGEGEHIWLQIRKREMTTADAARLLSKVSGLHPRHISFAGQKDRNAVTTQWFSVHFPGKQDIDFSSIWNDNFECLYKKRHDRKLKRGGLKGNAFKLVLRQCQGDKQAVTQRLQEIATGGVPDYFGEQRFGRGGSNLKLFDQLLSGRIPRGREKKAMLISSARSWLFNQVLARRVKDATWNQILPGEAVVLAGCRSLFSAEIVDETIRQRVVKADIHPSGPLPGDDGFEVLNDALLLEQSVLNEYSDLIEALCKQRVKGARRPLRIVPEDLDWQWQDDETLMLSFKLSPGAYATAVIRELAAYKDLRARG